MKGKVIRDYTEDNLQQKLSDFLAENPDIVIHKMLQSSSRDYTTITFIYYDNPAKKS